MKNKILLLILSALLSSAHHARAADNESNILTFKAEFISCYDGDTCTVNLANEKPIWGRNRKIRLSGIDTPEMRGKCDYEKQLAKQARDEVIRLLSNARKIELRVYEHNPRDNFGRLIAIVYADNINVNQYLLNNKLAVVEAKGYYDWCEVVK